MEDMDSDSLPAVMEVSTSALQPQAAAMEVPEPSRIIVISEGEIQRLKKDLEGLSSSVDGLSQELDVLCTPLVDLSETEDPTITAKSWMKQVREICYDTGDYLHDVMRAGAEFKILEARAKNATETLGRYGIQSKASPTGRLLPAPHGDLIDHVHKGMVDKVDSLMGTDKELKVVSIVGPEGVGKTTFAKRLYRRCVGGSGSSGTLDCWAFLRASAKPDILRLLTSIFIQIQRKRSSCHLDAPKLVDSIARYLQDKRYFIIIDDLWTAEVWHTIRPAFPNGDYCSRIITTTQIEGVAFACCGHQSKNVFRMEPLSDVRSQNLFFRIVFGSESGCPGDLKEVSHGIIRKCGGLPLATINIASMLPSTLNLEDWMGIRDSLPSTWTANPTSEWMKDVVTLMYSTLRPHLKTSLLYFSMYPVGWIFGKDDLVNQWVAEGFLDGVKGQETEETAGKYFDELVRRGLIQPVDTKNGKVLSCTLHHTIHDIIVKKSMDDNFVIVVDHFQSSIALPDMARRLSVQFGGARSAHIPDSIMVSNVRSLAFFGLLQCLLPISMVKYRHLRVLILHIWADKDKDSADLGEIRELLPLRYLKIACNITVKLPEDIQGLQYLEILEVDAILAAIPWDIGDLSELRILKFAIRELSSDDISVLKELVALTALSVYVKRHVKTAPTETIVFDKGGLSNLKFFTFRCRTPCLLIEEGAMPKIEKLILCFNSNEARQDGTNRITVEHLPGLQEISVKIRGAVAGEGPALVDAFVSNNENNPFPIVQLIESRQDQELGTLEEEDDIMEKEAHEYPGTQGDGSGERGNTEEDHDVTADDGTGKDENNEPDIRISMLTGPSSSLPVPVSAVVDKALSHMEPGEPKESVSTLVTDIIYELEEMLDEKACSLKKKEILDGVAYDGLERELTGSINQMAGYIQDYIWLH